MWEELHRPTTIVAIVLLIISILAGVLTSYYFYIKSEKAGQLSFIVEQVQFLDNRLGNLAPLSVLDSQGNKISGNIYAASVTVWNSGNAEIKSEDVREAFRVSIEGKPNVIDLSPVFFSRSNINGFQIDPRDGVIRWKHFDAGEGFRLRMIYADNQRNRIKISGYAVNATVVASVENEPLACIGGTCRYAFSSDDGPTAQNPISTNSATLRFIFYILLSLGFLAILGRCATWYFRGTRPNKNEVFGTIWGALFLFTSSLMVYTLDATAHTFGPTWYLEAKKF